MVWYGAVPYCQYFWPEKLYVIKCIKKGAYMAITVGDIYTAFPTFNPKDMIALVGTENFNGRSSVSLSKIANYKGGMAQELSVFVAQKDGKTFTNMLSYSKREAVIEAGAIKQTENNKDKKQDKKSIPSQIPMDKSVFDIKNTKKGKTSNF